MQCRSGKKSAELDWRKLALRQHQRKAIETCRAHISSRTTSAALIHHPTGSGKTGIMAVISALEYQSGAVLVVCPSDALVDQLVEEFKAKFWNKIGADERWLIPNTVRLYPRTVEAIAKQLATGPHVVCGTIQALQQIHASDEYALLVKKFAVVMFDEGHREPASLWAAAVRDLSAPTILFSATPYRNDYKLFDVDDKFIDFLSFQSACADGLIRPVEVMECDLALSPSAFVAGVIRLRDSMVHEGRLNALDKVIVRAGNEQAVDDLWQTFCEALKARSEKVIAIHENFSRDQRDGNLKSDEVPTELSARSETFLIHQFKLTEGIDDPRCRVLALFDAFGNERQLVQQIGRLTRHPGPVGTMADPAFVLARPSDGVQPAWNRFLQYDQSCIDNGGRPLIRGVDAVKAILQALPAMEYVNGKFRHRADFESGGVQEDILAPQSATVYETLDTFTIGDFGKAVDLALQEEDRIVMSSGAIAAGASEYRASIRFVETPFLDNNFFQSASLELTVFSQVGRRLFFYDSAGLSISDDKQLQDRVPPRAISSLLPDGGQNKVSSITLHNTDLGPLSLRARSMRARNLDRSGIFMGEQSHVVTVASGYHGDIRRSLNLRRGRVREAEGKYVPLSAHLEWCRKIAKELDGAPAPAKLFERFATEIPPPPDTTPKNILLDLWEFSDAFVDESGNAVEFDFEDVCSDIQAATDGPPGYPYMFSLTVNGARSWVYLKYDAQKRKYWIRATGLHALKDKHNTRVTLAARLNQAQPFRIIVDVDTVYAYGRFYSVSLDLRKSDGPGATVLGLLSGLDGLERLTSEKGELTGFADSWPDDSLFGFIDGALARANNPFESDFSGLVCDDIGEEAADFIGYVDDARPRVCLIAAKWKAGVPGAGASTLYDVIAQTLKNLIYLKSDGDPLPGSPKKFDTQWRLSGGAVPRHRRGPPSLKFRREFAAHRAMPATRKEAWLVLGGGMLSKQKVERSFRMKEPEPHTVQLFHLLLSLYATCQSVGVEPRIFCSK